MPHSISQTPDSHLMLWRMADALHIPLAEAILNDEVSPAQLSKMLVKCAHCPKPQYCALYLAARDSHADSPPTFCVARKTFAHLHALHPDRTRPEDAA